MIANGAGLVYPAFEPRDREFWARSAPKSLPWVHPASVNVVNETLGTYQYARMNVLLWPS